MNLVCIICSDGISASAEIYTTQCGHLFHYPCLIQWIERSKTCPQCRNKANEKTIHRVYLNQANTDCNSEDVTTLQSKLDNVQFQLMLKEKDLKSVADKYGKIKKQNVALREEIVELENKSRVHDSIAHALKDQISFFKTRAKERDKVAEELTKLKLKLKQMESIELAVNGSREQVSEMLKSQNDVESLVILVATLKKALLDAERKKMNMEHKYKQLQNDITKYKKDMSSLELSNKELKQEIEWTRSTLMKERSHTGRGNKIKQQNSSETNQNYGNTNLKNIFSLNSDQDSTLSVDSPSVEEKVVDILHSNSPYLCIKTGSTNTEICSQRSSTFIQTPSGTKQVSIFKRPPVKISKVESQVGEIVYNGLGGQAKEDIYPSGNLSGKGTKRHRIDSSVSNTKFRKVNPFLSYKK